MGIGKMLDRTLQVARGRNRIVVQKINQLAFGGAEGGVSLDRRLFSTRHEDLEFIGRIIEGTARRNGLDLGLFRPGGNQNCDARKRFVHHGKVGFERRSEKAERTWPFRRVNRFA
jgi:hypothetical protein